MNNIKLRQMEKEKIWGEKKRYDWNHRNPKSDSLERAVVNIYRTKNNSMRYKTSGLAVTRYMLKPLSL